MLSILLALSSNVAFATASLFFTDFAKKVSSSWMNYVKAGVAFGCFLAVLAVFQVPLGISNFSFIMLALSGVMGLMIGDIFLLQAFTHLGPGRVLMIFGFQPLLLGVASYYIFNDHFSAFRLIAILFLILCLFCFSMESFKQKGHWDLQGLLFALLGVGLDASGLLITKKVFMLNPDISVFLVNAVRSGAAFFGFFAISWIPHMKLNLVASYKTLNSKDKKLVLFAGFLGTFLSLSFYLKAVQIGNLATISAIAGTSPLFATLFEIYRGRKKLTRYLVLAVLSFLIGVGILIFV
jgi:drug/metabolite transporter (DMT)-like permease